MNDTLHIDFGSDVPAYRQIIDGLRAMLVAGVLKPGQRLPPVRQLAADLTVHHNTVAEAYRALADEGWVDLRRGRGATVLARNVPQPGPGDEVRLAQRITELAAQSVANGINRRRVAQILQDVSHNLVAKGNG
ncbi:MAG: GntR family transcriptional regulator [Planctomycetes bacterium]|nr:GntR family transcriptional regulator [Planctomycetota bacterium]